VAIFKSSGLDFELLEGRCLLNGTVLSLTLPVQGQTDFVQSVGTQSDDATAQHLVATEHGGDSSRLAENQRVDDEVMTRVLFPSSFTRDQPSILSASSALARLYGGDAGAPNEAAVVQGRPSTPKPVLWSPAVTAPVDVPAAALPTSPNQGPKFVVVVVVAEEDPLPTVLAKRSSPQSVSGEDDPAPARLNVASFSSAGKDQGNISGPRDASAALLPNVVPVSQAFTREDRATGTAPPQLQPGNASVFVTSFIAQGLPAAQFGAPNGPESVWQENASAMAPALQTRLDMLEPQLMTALAIEPFAAVLEPALPAFSALLTNVLPVDFASLDSSVKSFFEQIDRLGVKLSESNVNLLFASGIIAAATALAVEIGRRKMRPAVPAVTLQRQGSIPYSDYP
jgi:hypothetical protein